MQSRVSLGRATLELLTHMHTGQSGAAIAHIALPMLTLGSAQSVSDCGERQDMDMTNRMTPNQSPEPTWLGAAVLRLSVLLRHVTVPTWLSFFR
jgi:hypothetical protein